MEKGMGRGFLFSLEETLLLPRKLLNFSMLNWYILLYSDLALYQLYQKYYIKFLLLKISSWVCI